MRKYFFTVVVLLMMCGNSFNLAVMAADSCQYSVNPGVKERADVYEWRYKVVNGKLYRRLFNLTKAVWAGNWELVL